MSIVSPQFAAFVAAVLVLYHLVAQRHRTLLLLVASYLFYWLLAGRFIVVLALLTGANFALARRLRPPAPPGPWLWTGIALNLGTLLVLRHLHPVQPFAGPFIVAGLSFYALQGVSFLLDARGGKFKTPPGLADTAVYLAYFPKLVAGPIERPHVFLPQLARPRTVDDAACAAALTLIAVGITRKVVIADPLAALLPEKVFSTPLEFGWAVVLGTLVGYTFVLYNDFAGYTSIVRGSSKLFGIELSPNFAQPFFSRSFTDFWNRWHISLSHWLRDYLYLPLSRVLLRRNPSMRNVPSLVAPPLASMIASGLWHAASLNMFVWGVLHGIYLAVERVAGAFRPRRGRTVPAWRLVLNVIAVFVLGTAAFSFFRMEIGVAFDFWRRALSGFGADTAPASILLFAGASLGLDWLIVRHGEERLFHTWPRLARAGVLAIAVLLWFLMTRTTPTTPFVYQGF